MTSVVSTLISIWLKDFDVTLDSLQPFSAINVLSCLSGTTEVLKSTYIPLVSWEYIVA